jgi:fructokinase
MVSRVGSDDLGRELLAFLQSKGISTDLLQIDPACPTGIVNVHLDDKGIPSYEIVQPAAWDSIEITEEMHQLLAHADAMVFGSLACRAETTKKTLLRLLEIAPLRVFDVNLREPFFSQHLLDELLPKANIVKVNDLELGILAGWHGIPGDEAAQMSALREKFGIQILIVTKGERGAASLSSNGYCEVPGISVKVRDTIGSGDAFLSGYLSQLFSGANDRDCLQFANALGALVATKAGGTPALGQAEITEFLNAEAT